jgi:hypothetical protein
MASRMVLVMPEGIGDLASSADSSSRLAVLLQQTTLTGQLQPTGLCPVHQLVDQLLVHAIQLPVRLP